MLSREKSDSEYGEMKNMLAGFAQYRSAAMAAVFWFLVIFRASLCKIRVDNRKAVLDMSKALVITVAAVGSELRECATRRVSAGNRGKNAWDRSDAYPWAATDRKWAESHLLNELAMSDTSVSWW